MREPGAPPTDPPRPLLVRALALLALLALVASASWSAWAILTDRADFAATLREARPPSASPAGP